MEQRNKARAWEADGRQAINMTMNPVVMDSVTAVRTKQEKRYVRKSYNCGRHGHLAIDRSCLLKGRECAKCGRYGHFDLCCQGKGDNYATGRR